MSNELPKDDGRDTQGPKAGTLHNRAFVISLVAWVFVKCRLVLFCPSKSCQHVTTRDVHPIFKPRVSK